MVHLNKQSTNNNSNVDIVLLNKYIVLTGLFCMSNTLNITMYIRKTTVLKTIELNIFIMYVIILF